VSAAGVDHGHPAGAGGRDDLAVEDLTGQVLHEEHRPQEGPVEPGPGDDGLDLAVLPRDAERRHLVGAEDRGLHDVTDAGGDGRRHEVVLPGRLPRGRRGEQEHPLGTRERRGQRVGPVQVCLGVVDAGAEHRAGQRHVAGEDPGAFAPLHQEPDELTADRAGGPDDGNHRAPPPGRRSG
jgi:hypothetical protein